MFALAQKINAKYTALGDDSPLKVMQSHTWTENAPRVEDGLKHQEEAERLTKKAEETYRLRDAELAAVRETVKASRDLLVGVYRDNPKTLGEFGFVVDDSPRRKKAEAAK